MFYLIVVFGAGDDDNVELGVEISVETVHIGICRPHHVIEFFLGDNETRVGVLGRCARFNLDENDALPVPGNDVDFQMLQSPVALNDIIAFDYQKLGGGVLAPMAGGLLLGHGWVN